MLVVDVAARERLSRAKEVDRKMEVSLERFGEEKCGWHTSRGRKTRLKLKLGLRLRHGHWDTEVNTVESHTGDLGEREYEC